MRKILLFLAIFGSQFMTGQTLLSENFEGTTFPPTGWTRTSTNTARNWDVTTALYNEQGQSEYTISGNKSASVNWISSNNVADLTSPQFSLVGATDPALKFKAVVGYSYMIAINAGNLLAQVSINGGTTWTTVWTEDSETGFIDDGDGNPDSDLYNRNIVNVTVNLSPYIGQANVRLRFRYSATDADIVSIDDIEVVANSLSVGDFNENKVVVSPNPTRGNLFIKSDKSIKDTTVTDLTGKIVMKGNSDNLNIGSLSNGVYLLQVEFTDGSLKTEKIVKK
jgi:hypothetical protein